MPDGYDLAIIGSGGAAFAAAIRARALGARAAVIERDVIGGTCVNVGCVPSKALLAAADAFHRAGAHPFDGVPTSAGAPDLAALVAQKDELVAGLRKRKYVDLASEHGFELIEGQASFSDPTTIVVDRHALGAGAYVIATGAEPAVPHIPGLSNGPAGVPFLTSTTAMQLAEVPPRLVVIGGGFVGMEQGQLFSRLGAKVSIVGRLAPRAEPELAEWMVNVFAGEGIAVVPERAVGVRRDGGDIVVVTDRESLIRGDALMVAVGRMPRVSTLDVAAGGVRLDEKGFVATDDEQRTSNPHVFAAGDVTGGPQFVYAAAAQGAVAAENALSDGHRKVSYLGLPSVIFTSPSLASAGMTEAEALAAGYSCDCRVLELADVPRAIVNRDTRGALKLVADAATHRILGVHAVADQAGELMLAATYAIKFGLTVEDLADTWAAYLTMSEALKLAAQSFFVEVSKLSCCAA
jgi:mercuric reductase